MKGFFANIEILMKIGVMVVRKLVRSTSVVERLGCFVFSDRRSTQGEVEQSCAASKSGQTDFYLYFFALFLACSVLSKEIDGGILEAF